MPLLPFLSTTTENTAGYKQTASKLELTEETHRLLLSLGCLYHTTHHTTPHHTTSHTPNKGKKRKKVWNFVEKCVPLIG